MATSAATRLARNFQRNGLKQSWFQSLCQAKRYYYTGDRYQGYVSFFQPDELFGFAVRDDLPDKEYYFHSTDLHCRNVPRVRPLQPIEFSIVEGRGGNYIARDVTGPNSSELEFNHANMRLPTTQRTQLLSQLPNGLHERHKGVVVTVHADGKGGLIVPDRLNFNVVTFRMSEVQSTGYEKLDRFSEVEFFVRPGRYEGTRDRALCITRVGGGLITGERKEVGQRRRQLGAMYGPNDTKARIPPEFQKNRQRGVVIDYQDDKLFGFIACVDSPSDSAMFVHCDDCHISGKRMLRKGQLVEFVAVKDEDSQRTKALHVSGINQSVIHSVSENHYLPFDLTTMEYEPNDKKRHLGSIMTVDRNNGGSWAIIKPNDRGYASLFAARGELNTLGKKHFDVGSLVEFSVAKSEERTNDDENNSSNNDDNDDANDNSNKRVRTTRAVNITAQGGYPILTQRGPYGRYLQSKINLPTSQEELEVAPLSSDKTVTGYVSGYSRLRQFGTVEIEAPDGKRYQKAKFTLGDCILPENIDMENSFIGVGTMVTCNIVEAGAPTEEEEEIASRGGLLLSRQAQNIKSIDEEYLQVRERRQDDSKHDDNDDSHDFKTQTRERTQRQTNTNTNTREDDEQKIAL